MPWKCLDPARDLVSFKVSKKPNFTKHQGRSKVDNFTHNEVNATNNKVQTKDIEVLVKVEMRSENSMEGELRAIDNKWRAMVENATTNAGNLSWDSDELDLEKNGTAVLQRDDAAAMSQDVTRGVPPKVVEP